jgi:hypothetical protein
MREAFSLSSSTPSGQKLLMITNHLKLCLLPGAEKYAKPNQKSETKQDLPKFQTTSLVITL